MENNNETFTMIPHSLMKNKNLTDQDKLTLSVIISFIKNGKECFIGNETLGEMLGISKNAASSRILRLQKIGCISLRYTYREGTNEIDKRFITLISMTPKVSSDRQEVSSTKRRVSSVRQRGIVHETKGYRPTDEGVSSKLGGIIQPYNISLLNNLSDKGQNNLLNSKIQVEERLVEVVKLLKEDIFSTGDDRFQAMLEKDKLIKLIKNMEQDEIKNEQ